jgi:hypothetical protein
MGGIVKPEEFDYFHEVHLLSDQYKGSRLLLFSSS